MRSPVGIIIITAIMLLFDWYFFQGVRTVMHGAGNRTKNIITVAYWSLTVLTIVWLCIFAFAPQDFMSKKMRTYLFAIVIGLFFAKIVGSAFLLIDDLRRIAQWVGYKTFFKGYESNNAAGEGLSRSQFLSWLGIAAGGGLFGSLLYGFGNKYHYEVRKVNLGFPNLPNAFKGLRIAHISDIHCGSLQDKKGVAHGVQMILDQQPDVIFFTGDLVNDRAIETQALLDVFSQLKAPMGVYSILGNHDYGDYAQWPFEGVDKIQNLNNLKKTHADMGWRLLLNEHVLLEKGDEKIAVLGIENWSAKARFPKHGRLDMAHANTENIPFKILLSHDPSHWHAQVTPEYKDIDLTLSGHTHGMQFGVEIPGFRWSPVQYMYHEWAGLYEDAAQKLYVNRGFGFIGYPGRVGILPEITIIELV